MWWIAACLGALVWLLALRIRLKEKEREAQHVERQKGTAKAARTAFLEGGFAPVATQYLQQVPEANALVLLFAHLEWSHKPAEVHMEVVPVTQLEATALQTTAQQTTAQRTTAQRTAALQTTAQQTAAQQTGAQRTAAQQTGAQRTAALQTTAQQTTAQRTTAQRTAALQTTAQQTAAQQTGAQRTAAQWPALAAYGLWVTKDGEGWHFSPPQAHWERLAGLEGWLPKLECFADVAEPVPAEQATLGSYRAYAIAKRAGDTVAVEVVGEPN
jgi:hypothetical protein